MKIETRINGAIVTVGIPSKNHVRIEPAIQGAPVEFGLPDWERFKKAVDKMFKASQELSD